MRILYISPIGTDVYDARRAEILGRAAAPGTTVELVSLPADRPRHLEYQSYVALVVADIVGHVYAARNDFDAVVIGGFYDLGLSEAREVSGRAVVTAPCQAATAIACNLGNTFSIVVGQRKWIPKMRANVRAYGYDHAMASMRPLGLGVHDFQNSDRTRDRLLEVGRQCVDEDGAEVLIIGCNAGFGFNEMLSDALGVPVIDSLQASFKYAEFLADAALRFGWYPSRKWGSAAPPEDEIEDWGLFADAPAAGNRTRVEGRAGPG